MAGRRRRTQGQMATVRKNEAKAKAWVIEEDEYHPDPRIAARYVDEKDYIRQGREIPWAEPLEEGTP